MSAAVTRTWEASPDDPGVEPLWRGGPAYTRPVWLRFLARVYGVRACYLGWEEPGGGRGAWPLLLDRRGPFRLAGSPLSYLASVPYMGPVGEGWTMEAALQALAGYARANRCAVTEFCFLEPAGPTSVPPPRPGFTRDLRETRVVDLAAGEDALWDGLATRCRTAIRQAGKAGLTVELATEPDRAPAGLAEYWALAEETYLRSRMPPPHPRKLYEAWFRDGAPPTLYGAVRMEGRLLAAGLFPYGDGDMYYHDGVSATDARALRPNNLLLWEVMRWGARRGLENFDLVGTNVPGLRLFKASFGGAVRPYWAVRLAPGGIARAGLAAARWARRAARWLGYRWGRASRGESPQEHGAGHG